VWKWRENQSRIKTRIMDHGSTSRETARALEPLNSTSEDKEFTQVKKVTQKSINKIRILTWLRLNLGGHVRTQHLLTMMMRALLPWRCSIRKLTEMPGTRKAGRGRARTLSNRPTSKPKNVNSVIF
jgi:hypothetical protein